MKTKLLLLLTVLVQTIFAQCPPEGSISLTSQAEVDAFVAQYPNCTIIDGSLTITGYNGNTTNLAGLTSITSITGDLSISGTQLTTLNGALPNLSNVGNSIYITGNPLLTTIDGLNQITSSLIGLLQIHNNNNLVDIGGLNGLTGTLNLYITNNPALQTIDGLSALSGFIQVLYVEWNPSLTTINTLNQITTACVISIGNCTALTTLNAFNQLNVIVPFGQNNQGRETSQTLGGWSPILWIHSTALTNLNNFSSLTNFNGFMLALDNNNSLTDLSGLSNVLPSSVGLLRLNSNDNLANCAVQVVCNIIDLATAQIFITNNASSCESESAVQTACAALSSIEFDLESKIAIYPNPFQSQITFELGNSYENVTIVINDITGKQLYQNSFSGNQLVINNLSNLPSGIYVATLNTENGTSITKKLIK